MEKLVKGFLKFRTEALRVNMSETLSCIEFTEQGEKGCSG